MTNSLAIAIIAGLGGMFGWGFADFFAKKTIDVIAPIPSLVWAHLFGTLIFVGFAVFRALSGHGFVEFPTHLSTWGGLLFFGVLQMIVYWLVYMGFEKGQLAVLNPVFASYSGLVALFSVIFLGEAVSPYLGIALVVIFFGLMLLNVDIPGLRSRKLKLSPGLKEVGSAAVLAAIWTLGWDKFVSGHDALSYALLMYAFMSIAAYALSLVMKVKVTGVDKKLWKFLVGIGLGEAVAYLAISWGYSATSRTSIVALISGCFSLPTIILAQVFLKEKINRVQTSGIFAIIVGIILVSI